MGKVVIGALKDPWFIVFSVFTMVLFAGGFFAPPMGVIDGSLLKAGGILFAYLALHEFGVAFRAGLDARFRHGDTEIAVGSLEESRPHRHFPDREERQDYNIDAEL